LKILITGGGGFIGSHLSERLLKEGHNVIILDNFHTGRRENVRHLLDNHYLEIIRHDVVDPLPLEVDQIYNLACPASPIHYQRSPMKTVLTSVMGAINMLTLARDIHARVLQASTSEIYGNPLKHPQKEDYWGNVNTIGPRSCYDEGKRVAETLFFDFHREAGVDIRVARIFNTYGPRMCAFDGRVVSNLVLQALRNEPITIFGEGSQTRSFCYVDEMVDGLIQLMNCEGFIGPVNLGNPDERSIKSVASLIVKLCDSKSEIVYQPMPKDDPNRRKPDISLADQALNWRPRISLEEGLPRVIEYFRPVAKTCAPPSKRPN
jgi:UDP-glucuronate decarboxylase